MEKQKQLVSSQLKTLLVIVVMIFGIIFIAILVYFILSQTKKTDAPTKQTNQNGNINASAVNTNTNNTDNANTAPSGSVEELFRGTITEINDKTLTLSLTSTTSFDDLDMVEVIVDNDTPIQSLDAGNPPKPGSLTPIKNLHLKFEDLMVGQIIEVGVKKQDNSNQFLALHITILL